MRIQGAGSPPAATPQDPRLALRRLAHELEGVFMTQLFQAMRASVPESGLVESAPGREMFTSLMDEKLAGEAAQRMRNGLGDALYRQLCRGLPPTEDAPR